MKHNNKLYSIQRELESDMQTRGVEYYRSEVRKAIEKGNESTTLYGILAMKKSVDSVANGIDEFLAESFKGKAGRLSSSAHLLSLVDPEETAYIGLKQVVDSLSKNQTLTKCAMSIANALEDQCKFALFEKNEPKWFKRLVKDVNTRTSNRYYRRYAIIHTMNKKALIDYEVWSIQEKLHLGCKVLDLIVSKTGIIKQVTHTYGKNKKVLHIAPTDTTLNWINSVNLRGEVLSPKYMPCVIEPRDWTSPYSGGYHTRHIKPLPMIKTSNRKYLTEMEYHKMDEEYNAINALQKTKWAVNKQVLDVMKTVWESGDSWSGLPSKDDAPLPPSPFPNKKKADMNEAELLQLREWKHAASKVHQANARMASKRLQVIRTISMANKFKEFDCFYYVYQNDFRGRKYVASSFLTPQGPDYSKGLLCFSETAPLTREGMYWLAVHGANCFGEDKVSFDNRNGWVEENTDKIIQTATNPYEYKWWQDADSPWQFLAFCFEWKEIQSKLSKNLRLGDINSRIPVSLDGSNNGLQHLSAIARDRVGAISTNLVPSETPNDIYQDVANEVIKVLETRKSHDEMARQWLEFGINRKTTKRPVMVVPYGGKLFSTRQYIEDYIVDKMDVGITHPWGNDLWQPTFYLAQIVWECIGKVIVSARTVMDWLQQVSSNISKLNLPVMWMTPTGFLVQQMYPETKSRRITTYIDNTLIKPQVREQDFSKADRRRSINGASPNFIHSMDSAAMTITINKCVEVGIKDFAMVHDSYGVHASYVPVLHKLTRQSFSEMYQNNDVLTDFETFAKEVTDEIPPQPEKGDLDLEVVKQSNYFFS